MLTAKQGEWDQAEALDSGADDFLSKPFSYPVLLARLRALIRRGSGGSGALLRVGDLCLDTAARRCTCGSVRLELTAREFALLEYLMLRPGVVVSKTDLLDHVWDLGHDGDSNVVEVYIGYLRRKLERACPGAQIVTVRGAGYRLAVDGE
jgi:DNA-binding response OmpR family regulator